MKLLNRQKRDLSKLRDVIDRLCRGESLTELPYRTHKLKGRYAGFLECHIEPDWIFIYQIKKTELILVALRTGSHTDF